MKGKINWKFELILIFLMFLFLYLALQLKNEIIGFLGLITLIIFVIYNGAHSKPSRNQRRDREVVIVHEREREPRYTPSIGETMLRDPGSRFFKKRRKKKRK